MRLISTPKQPHSSIIIRSLCWVNLGTGEFQSCQGNYKKQPEHYNINSNFCIHSRQVIRIVTVLAQISLLASLTCAKASQHHDHDQHLEVGRHTQRARIWISSHYSHGVRSIYIYFATARAGRETIQKLMRCLEARAQTHGSLQHWRKIWTRKHHPYSSYIAVMGTCLTACLRSAVLSTASVVELWRSWVRIPKFFIIFEIANDGMQYSIGWLRICGVYVKPSTGKIITQWIVLHCF